MRERVQEYLPLKLQSALTILSSRELYVVASLVALPIFSLMR